jgi:hypothetical protein
MACDGFPLTRLAATVNLHAAQCALDRGEHLFRKKEAVVMTSATLPLTPSTSCVATGRGMQTSWRWIRPSTTKTLVPY